MVVQSHTRIRQFINFSFFRFVSSKRFHSPEYKVGIISYPHLSSCSTGILRFLVASFCGEYKILTAEMILCRQQQRIIRTSKHFDTHTSFHLRIIQTAFFRHALFVLSISVMVCNWLILTSGPQCHVSYLRRFLQTISIGMRATLAKFPTTLYYLIIQHVHSILRDNLFLKQKP